MALQVARLDVSEELTEILSGLCAVCESAAGGVAFEDPAAKDSDQRNGSEELCEILSNSSNSPEPTGSCAVCESEAGGGAFENSAAKDSDQSNGNEDACEILSNSLKPTGSYRVQEPEVELAWSL